jgi:hypothetical protein
MGAGMTHTMTTGERKKSSSGPFSGMFRTRRIAVRVAVLLLVLFVGPYFFPLAIPFAGVARAQSGGLEGLGGALMPLLLIMLLMQLFQGLMGGGGGGNTPQQGPAEEQPGQQGTINPTKSGRRGDGSQNGGAGGRGGVTTPTPTAIPVETMSAFLLENNEILPSVTTIVAGESLTLYNLTDAAHTVKVQRLGAATAQETQTIAAGQSYTFPFASVGEFNLFPDAATTSAAAVVVVASGS